MSKLYDQYLKLKKEDSEKLYLFKCGTFYYMLDEDAKKISENFPLKLLPFTEDIVKCSFPITRLGYYIAEFQKLNFDFEIIDNKYSKIENYQDYLNNENLKNIINKILELDLNNITMRQSYDILEDLQLKCKSILDKEV